MDATALERDAVQFARLAVQRDHEGRYSEAVFYYKVGSGVGRARAGSPERALAEPEAEGRGPAAQAAFWLAAALRSAGGGRGGDGLFAVPWPCWVTSRG